MESYEKISWEVLDPGTTVSRVILSVHITLGNRVMYAISGLSRTVLRMLITIRN